jgi:hypothetical protein
MKQVYAYSFKTELSLDEIFTRLNEMGLWRWSRRYNDNWGDYVSTRALSDYAMVKIFQEPDHYAVNVVFEVNRATADAEFSEFQGTLLNQILPSIGAREVTDTDTYD